MVMRINKALSLAKIASRRGAEKLILEGRVSVNGVIIRELGIQVMPKDSVEVDGNVVHIPYEDKEYSYIILNKPIEYISSVYDPQGRKTVLSLLPLSLRKERVYPIGRLDYFSEGLLLLSNDGELTYKLTHPKYHVEKEYNVTIRSFIDSKKLELLHEGFTLSTGEQLAPMRTRLVQRDKNISIFSIILHQGINRQIRRICADMKWVILRLERLRIGSLSLKDLCIARGKYKVVSKEYIVEHCNI